MSRFRKLSQTLWHCQYHIVWSAIIIMEFGQILAAATILGTLAILEYNRL